MPELGIRELLERWDNGSRLSAMSRDERVQTCSSILDSWYSNLIRPNRPRTETETFNLAMSLYAVIPSTPARTIDEQYRNRVALFERFAAVLRQPEVGLLPSDEEGIPPEPLQTVAATRVNAVLRALDSLRDIAVGIASMNQASVSPFVETQTLQSDKPMDEPHISNLVNRWLENDLLRRGYVRYVHNGTVDIMGPVYTAIGMNTGVKEFVCEGSEYVTRYLSCDRRHEALYFKYEPHMLRINAAATLLLRVSKRCIRDWECDQHMRSFENGIFHSGKLIFTPYGKADWVPQRLSDYREAVTDPARRAVVDDVMEEVESYRSNTANGRVEVDGTSLTEEWRGHRTEWGDAGVGLFANLSDIHKSSLIYIPNHLPMHCLTCPWHEIDVPAWNKIWTTQGYNREEILFINGMFGRSFFDVSASNGGDGLQMMIMLLGLPGTGKGIAIEVLSKMFPNERIATLTNRPESVFYGMDFEDTLVMIITEMNANFKKHMDMAELMQFVSAERVKLKVKKGKSINIPRWPAQLIAASNEQSLEGVGWGRRLFLILMNNVVPESEHDDELPKKLDAELPKLCVLFARCYHLMIEKIKQGGAGIRSVIPRKFRKAMDSFRNRLSPLRHYICDSGRVLRASTIDGADPEDYYASWDDLKESFNTWNRIGNGTPINLIDEENYIHVFRALGLHLVFGTREDPVTKSDRNTGWVVGIRSLT